MLELEPESGAYADGSKVIGGGAATIIIRYAIDSRIEVHLKIF